MGDSRMWPRTYFAGGTVSGGDIHFPHVPDWLVVSSVLMITVSGGLFAPLPLPQSLSPNTLLTFSFLRPPPPSRSM